MNYSMNQVVFLPHHTLKIPNLLTTDFPLRSSEPTILSHQINLPSANAIITCSVMKAKHLSPSSFPM